MRISSEALKPLSPVRSFVRRTGHLTHAQRRNLDTLWDRYGLETDTGILDFSTIFGRRAAVWLEIGFGTGDFLANQAAAHPEVDMIGIDVHLPGVGSLLGRLHTECLSNVRLFCADAVDVLRHCIPALSLERVYLLFPDPWPKQRHHKRRLVQPEFITLLETTVAPGGVLYLATDWEDYAVQMMATLSAAKGWHNLAGPASFGPRASERHPTRFERRGLQLGHKVWDLAFVRDATMVGLGELLLGSQFDPGTP